MVPTYVAAALFCLGVLLGLILGPDSEREHARRIDGWIEGYRFARRQKSRAKAQQPEGSDV